MMTSLRLRRPAAIGTLILALGVGGVAGAYFLSRPVVNAELLPILVQVDGIGGAPLWVARHEVSVREWNRCHAAGACSLELRPPVGVHGEDAPDYPATGLSYVDVEEYLSWINSEGGHPFRLPTSDEWKQLAADVMPPEPDPIFTDPDLSWASSYLTENLGPRALKPIGSWATTAEGIADLDGNVWEWTQDCYKGQAGGNVFGSSCPAFVVEGEHEAVIPYLVRDPARGGCAVGAPPAHLGMRLVTRKAPPNVAIYEP